MKQLVREIAYQCRYALPIWLVGLLTNWLPENRITIRIRGILVRPFLKKCGSNLQLARGITFLNNNGISIGDNVYIATGCWLDGIGGLTIDDEVELSPFVVITTSSHCFRDNSVRYGGSHKLPVRIGRGSWIASHAVIVAGVTVGSGTLVGANAVVSKSLPNNVFAGGVPARVIGSRIDRDPDIFSRFN